MSILEQVGFDALKAQAQRYLRGLTNEIKVHITEVGAAIMSNSEEILARHDAAIATEMQQLVDAVNAQTQALTDLQTAVDNLTASEAEKAALQEALDAANAANADILSRVEAGTSVLESDDPTS